MITALTRHRVSANLLMLVFILAGLWATTQLNTRFFPTFDTNVVSVGVSFSGNDPAEIEEAIVVPLENALRSVNNLREMYSYSRDGSGSVVLEFPDGTDMEQAVRDVKAEVERVSLPNEADAPRTVLHARSENVAVMTIATDNRDELRDLARRIESDFNAQGIAKITAEGIPTEEIKVLIDQSSLIELGLTIEQVGRALRSHNVDDSVGSMRGLGNVRKIRADSKSSDFDVLYQIPVASDPDGGITYLRDIARIERDVADDQVEIRYNGRPAVSFQVTTTGDKDLITTAGEVYDWLAKVRTTIPPTVDTVMHDESWRAVDSRLRLLLKNGLGGMLIVIGLLYIFLSSQVALWVSAGIPVAMLGTLFVFSQTGGTINMISMFALIMAVGIIVDDAIVVGENAQYRLSRKEPPMRAVISAAKTMFPPVFASSFTTVASFLPLFLVGGAIGGIIFDIPLIIICILIAALVECFCILPGHLYQSFARRSLSKRSKFRAAIDRGFDNFRERAFRPVVSFAVRHSVATVAACLVMLGLSVSLLTNGFVNYRFFPGAEGRQLVGTVEFNVGTPRDRMEEYVGLMVNTLGKVAEETGDGKQLVEHVSAKYGAGGRFSSSSDNRARVEVELVEPDNRNVTTQQLAAKWRRALGDPPPGVETLSMRSQRGGPPGQEIEIQITGTDINTLKVASVEIQEALSAIPGVSSVEDDTPYGEDQVLFDLTPLGQSLNLNVDAISLQLRHALSGFAVQTFTEGVDEVDLLVLYDSPGDALLDSVYIRLSSGDFAPLGDVVTWRQGQGFEEIQRKAGRPAITVSADLDDEASLTAGDVIDTLNEGTIQQLRDSLGIAVSFEGKQSDQKETVSDMLLGLALAMVLIYIILAWVFNSWTLPIVVMITMPLGVIGTIIGHWILGLTMSILSFFGMFTLMGIIVNNSIVLVRCFMDLGVANKDGAMYDAAIVEASCLRLRAVLLTSLTTIGGLTPLMFETSLQAQFLIPMAASIVFGLGFATILILFFMPACMSIHGSVGRALRFLLASDKSENRERHRHQATTQDRMTA